MSCCFYSLITLKVFHSIDKVASLELKYNEKSWKLQLSNFQNVFSSKFFEFSIYYAIAVLLTSNFGSHFYLFSHTSFMLDAQTMTHFFG